MNSETPSDDDFSFKDDPLAPHEPGEGPVEPMPRSARVDPELRREIEEEILFQETRSAMLASTEPPKMRPLFFWGLLAITAVLFVLSFMNWGSRLLGLSMVVLLIHEGGHFLGMWLFGYRNIRIFFIPFFGAAVTGKNDTAAAWKQAITILLGPIPGILIGLGLYLACTPNSGTWLFDLCLVLVSLNAFNLLPVLPLDGGRLFDILFLARLPWPGTIYRLLAVVALVAIAYSLGDPTTWIVFGVTAALVLMAIPLAHILARSRRSLRDSFPDLPIEVDQLTGEQHRQIYKLVRKMRPFETDPVRLAPFVRELHGQAAAKPASVWTSTIFMNLYVAGIALTVSFILTVGQTERQQAELLAERYFEVAIRDFPDPVSLSKCIQLWESSGRLAQKTAYEQVMADPRSKQKLGPVLNSFLLARLPNLKQLDPAAAAKGNVSAIPMKIVENVPE